MPPRPSAAVPNSTPRRAPRTLVAIGVALSIALTATTAFGHDTWIIARSGIAKVGTSITVSLTSGSTFLVDDHAIDRARVMRAVARIAGTSTPLPAPTSGAHALRYTWTPRTAGVATIGVSLRPKTLTLEPDKIEEYLTEIDAAPEIRSAWKSLNGTRPWIESYSKHATTYVRVGVARDSSWRQPLGFHLEIVPERDPASLRAGDTLPVRVLRAGVPLKDFAIGRIHERSGKPRFTRTDAAGRATIVLDAGGRWLLNGTDLRRSATPELVWESDFVTATIHVAPR